MKIIHEFSDELSLPLSHIVTQMIRLGIYPDKWKIEYVTPVPKVFPPKKIRDLRPISGMKNFAKIFDKLFAVFMTQDMSQSCDKCQYGNEKGLSTNHYLIKMLHKILLSTDKNSKSDKFAVILTMIDWSQAFDRQSHLLGVRSFIRNGVRMSLIPVLISFFQKRRLVVKWNKTISTPRQVNGGGPQGGNAAILEYLSQTCNNLDYIPEDEC